MRRTLFTTALVVLTLSVCVGAGEWATRLWLDRFTGQTAICSSWYPYTEFLAIRALEDSGRFFEYADADALGRVAPPGDSPRVWFFGGSTMEGEMEGEDDNWLAVEFARRCRDAGRPCSVRNWGQSAYQIHQEKYLFMELLRTMRPPDVAVFYDGVNEIETTGEKWMFSSSYGINRGLFDLLPDQRSVIRRLSRRAVTSLAMLQVLANGLIRGSASVVFEHSGLSWSPDDRPPAVAQNYRFNVRVIEAICQEYGIRCFFVWQPELLTRDWTSDEEKRILATIEPFRENRLAVHASIRNDPWLRGKPNFLFLSDLFRDLRRHVYKTHCHVTAESQANRFLADRIYRLVFEGLKDESPLPPEPGA